jgi:o-succinylbenzoate synthase
MVRADALPEIDEVLSSARVVSIPLTTRFRGVEHREAVLLRGPAGWSEFSPFLEYEDAEAATWLAAALDFGWRDSVAVELRSSIRVNATLPAVSPDRIEAVLARYDGCRTVKIKVGEVGQTLADDIERVRETRRLIGAEGRIRLDANGAWNLDEAEHAVRALEQFDLEYIEQPCASLDELAELRRRIHRIDVLVAADESVRRAADPLEVVRAEAADVIVIKAAPLGGIDRALAIVEAAGLPAVVSSALESSVGLSMGAALAARLPQIDYDFGLGTGALLADDVTLSPVVPVGGLIGTGRVEVDEDALRRLAAPDHRQQWWRARLTRCHALLADPA